MRTTATFLLTAISLSLAACDCGCVEPRKDSPQTAPLAATTPATAAAPTSPLAPLVDQVTPGDDANERAHNQQGDNTETGDWTDRTYRHSADGWFSWDLKVDPTLPNELVVTYAGVDQRTFQILIDGKPFSSQVQPGNSADHYDHKYPIPLDLTKGKQKITVRFQSINNEYAGGVFGVKTMRAAK